MKRILIAVSLVIILLAISSPELYGQCPMCRATAESNLANGGSEGKGLNNGILYLLCTPYILIGTIYYFWKKGRKAEADLVD